MSGTAIVLTIAGAVFFVGVAGLGPICLVLIRRRSPWAICARLQRGHDPISYKTSFAWDPAKPLGERKAARPGWATYTLTSDGLVCLDFVGQDGHEEQTVGPLLRPPRVAL